MLLDFEPSPDYQVWKDSLRYYAWVNKEGLYNCFVI